MLRLFLCYMNNRHYHSVYTFGMRISKLLAKIQGDILDTKYASAARIVNIVVYVGDAVCVFYYNTLKGGCDMRARVVNYSVADLPRQIKSLSVVFKHLNDSQALLIMRKVGIKAGLHSVLARVSERRVSHVVSESCCLGKILVESEGSCDNSRYPSMRRTYTARIRFLRQMLPR